MRQTLLPHSVCPSDPSAPELEGIEVVDLVIVLAESAFDIEPPCKFPDLSPEALLRGCSGSGWESDCSKVCPLDPLSVCVEGDTLSFSARVGQEDDLLFSVV